MHDQQTTWWLLCRNGYLNPNGGEDDIIFTKFSTNYDEAFSGTIGGNGLDRNVVIKADEENNLIGYFSTTTKWINYFANNTGSELPDLRGVTDLRSKQQLSFKPILERRWRLSL